MHDPGGGGGYVGDIVGDVVGASDNEGAIDIEGDVVGASDAEGDAVLLMPPPHTQHASLAE